MAKEIKISGKIESVVSGNNRAIYLDCGGVIYAGDFLLRNCGGYNIEDRVTVTITPCEKDEYHYPPKGELLVPSFLK